MKGYTKSIMIACLFTFFISGCYMEAASDEEIINIQNPRHDIIGTWRLTTRCNWAWGDGCVDVTELDQKVIIIFDENGIYTSYRNDTLIIKADYKIVIKENNLVRRVEEIIEIEDYGNYSFDLSNDSRLWMSLIAYDAPSSAYTRMSYETDI